MDASKRSNINDCFMFAGLPNTQTHPPYTLGGEKDGIFTSLFVFLLYGSPFQSQSLLKLMVDQNPLYTCSSLPDLILRLHPLHNCCDFQSILLLPERR